jgi:3-deoxy-D-manno-octulosonic-acid transferase
VRLLYLALSYLLAPFVVLLIVWKGLRNRAYWDRVEERFGFGRSRTDRRAIWIHAVSVGEVTAASAMVRALMESYPHLPVVVTTVTPTGARRVGDLFGDEVIHSYIPYDMPGAVARFFDRFNPRLAVIMETELWPNLYNECGRRGVPLVLANARVSPRSVYKYRRFVSLFSETLSHGIVIAAQSRRDADRFRWIGAPPERTHVVGNIKFDLELPAELVEQGQALRAALTPPRPVWIAASTHEGEEDTVLEAHRQVRETLPDALLILVPRHPERFQAVAGLLSRRGFSFVRRSGGEPVATGTEVFLGDTLGELTMFYAAADVAFVGGSLLPIGGHNALEPAALGLPILAGPYTFNAEDIAEMLQEAGAATEVNDADSMARAVAEILADPALRAERGAAGQRIVAENRGALERLMRLLQPLLDEFPVS